MLSSHLNVWMRFRDLPRHLSCRLGLLVVLFGCWLAGLPDGALADESPAVEKPNILFILADDYSYDSVAATGNSEVKTPHIDSIARSGVTFSHAYNMGAWNGAVCVASRTMLNTGRFVWDAQKLNLKLEQQARRTWPQLMHDAGYETFFTGKWHVALKPADLFDRVGHVRGGMPQQTPMGYNRPAPGNDWSPYDRSRGGFWQGGTHWSEVVGDDAVGFLKQTKRSSKPFFMYVAFNAPHDPRQSPKQFVDMYPRGQIQIPRSFLPQYPYQDKMGCGPSLRDERLAPFPRTKLAVQIHRQEYYAIISHMDQQIGRILNALKESGKAESTYVIFTADHGLACGNHGLMGKQNMYEHSLRVPCFLQGPDLQAGQTLPNRIYLQDLMATTLQLGQLKPPPQFAFKSLLPLIKGSTDRHHESIYGGYLKLQRMVIQDDWKLIMYPRAKAIRLYDLSRDPLELHDVSNEPDQVQRLNSLFAEFKRLQAVTHDQLEVPTAILD